MQATGLTRQVPGCGTLLGEGQLTHSIPKNVATRSPDLIADGSDGTDKSDDSSRTREIVTKSSAAPVDRKDHACDCDNSPVLVASVTDNERSHGAHAATPDQIPSCPRGHYGCGCCDVQPAPTTPREQSETPRRCCHGLPAVHLFRPGRNMGACVDVLSTMSTDVAFDCSESATSNSSTGIYLDGNPLEEGDLKVGVTKSNNEDAATLDRVGSLASEAVCAGTSTTRPVTHASAARDGFSIMHREPPPVCSAATQTCRDIATQTAWGVGAPDRDDTTSARRCAAGTGYGHILATASDPDVGAIRGSTIPRLIGPTAPGSDSSKPHTFTYAAQLPAPPSHGDASVGGVSDATTRDGIVGAPLNAVPLPRPQNAPNISSVSPQRGTPGVASGSTSGSVRERPALLQTLCDGDPVWLALQSRASTLRTQLHEVWKRSCTNGCIPATQKLQCSNPGAVMLYLICTRPMRDVLVTI